MWNDVLLSGSMKGEGLDEYSADGHVFVGVIVDSDVGGEGDDGGDGDGR